MTLSLWYKICDQHEQDGKWERSPATVKSQAECGGGPFYPVEALLPVEGEGSVVRKEVMSRVHAQQGDDRNLDNLILCNCFPLIYEGINEK